MDYYAVAITEANKYSKLLNIEFDINALKDNDVRTLLNENQKQDYSL